MCARLAWSWLWLTYKGAEAGRRRLTTHGNSRFGLTYPQRDCRSALNIISLDFGEGDLQIRRSFFSCAKVYHPCRHAADAVASRSVYAVPCKSLLAQYGKWIGKTHNWLFFFLNPRAGLESLKLFCAAATKLSANVTVISH